MLLNCKDDPYLGSLTWVFSLDDWIIRQDAKTPTAVVDIVQSIPLLIHASFETFPLNRS